jgi:hypothetical protein
LKLEPDQGLDGSVRLSAFSTADRQRGGIARVATISSQNCTNWRRETPRDFKACGSEWRGAPLFAHLLSPPQRPSYRQRRNRET